ncbi:DgyrCDS7510 [Dimorphilus gyrociliatus]|uniref:Trimethyllysine dioxygenase, mitochondrial n=1 Tax=Dimorphilus gyrociliatus TaxID=2664684 RepID=A0A7I8VW65_9ANNE|nr:DgyrCDS7510 [Dimorphilus gyrociliatus]
MALFKSLQLLKNFSPDVLLYRKFATRIVDFTSSSVHLRYKGKIKEVNNIWLRDNCHCPKCFNNNTKQKIIIPPIIPSKIRAIQADINGTQLNITWGDGHKSSYDTDTLFKKTYPKTLPEKQLWDDSSMSKDKLGSSTYDQIISGDVTNLMNSLSIHGLGIVENVPTTPEDTEKLCESIVPIQNTIFGGFWTFTSDQHRADTAYTSLKLGVHTDTSYYVNPMGIQIFHCLHHEGEGGETLLADGFRAAEELRKQNPDYFDILLKYRVPHVYTGDHGNELYAEHSILSTDCYGQLEGVRYNHYDRSTILNIPDKDIGTWYKALKCLSKIMEDESSIFEIKLRPGTTILIDNWRVLHGRNSFTGKRIMSGCYYLRDDWINLAKRIAST